jgi:gluconokinase
MVVVIMGASGAGKSTIGAALAADLGWPFVDGDDHQPAANIEKMRRGHPLDDGDRAVWLERLRRVIARAVDRRESTVVACSALKARYRDVLRDGLKPVRFVYLKADADLLRRRLETRLHHFAGPELIASQLHDLEEPAEALIVNAADEPRVLVTRIREAFGL